MPKGYRNPDSNLNDPEYIDKRRRNNEAIRRTREKAKMKEEETRKRVNELQQDINEKRMGIKHIAESFDFTSQIYKDLEDDSEHELVQEQAKIGSEVMKIAREIAANERPPSQERQQHLMNLLEQLEKPLPELRSSSSN